MSYSYHNRNNQQFDRYDQRPNHHDNKQDRKHDRFDYHSYKPINQDEVLLLKGVGSPAFIKTLEESLPAIFTRQTASKAIGGLISPKTFSNLDSLGIGPPVKMKIGSKVGYEKQSFLAWLKTRLKNH